MLEPFENARLATSVNSEQGNRTLTNIRQFLIETVQQGEHFVADVQRSEGVLRDERFVIGKDWRVIAVIVYRQYNGSTVTCVVIAASEVREPDREA